MPEQPSMLELWAAVWAAELRADPSKELKEATKALKTMPVNRKPGSRHYVGWDAVDFLAKTNGRISAPDINLEAYDRLLQLLR